MPQKYAHEYPPMLSEEENRELFILAKSGDVDAERKFFYHMQRHVHCIAISRKFYQFEYEEKYSACQMGLLKAYKYYDVNFGVTFEGFSAHCMRGELYRIVRHERRLGQIPREKKINLEFPIGYDDHGLPHTVQDTISSPDEEEKTIAIMDLQNLVNAWLESTPKPILVQAFKCLWIKRESQRSFAKRNGFTSNTRVTRLYNKVIVEIRKTDERLRIASARIAFPIAKPARKKKLKRPYRFQKRKKKVAKGGSK